ncbi:hypothetical protein Agub_g10489 [Astrephomene gubernaculifera]|uniref:Uncharacterized protein n=1 Tax=Astrephomene gubernaculifera TaxID=47775 RepID=A0AAD3DZG8_9CHLO|nr:hypothetical protein Agub_g10489 [Astrephomene gubernaculifera]
MPNPNSVIIALYVLLMCSCLLNRSYASASGPSAVVTQENQDRVSSDLALYINLLSELLHSTAKHGIGLWAQVRPVLQPAGISVALGYVCGVFIKKTVRILMLLSAVLLTGVQLLSYVQWVTVHWDRIHADLWKLLAGNSSQEQGDGVDSSRLLLVALERLTDLSAQGLPATAGFTAGVALAFMPSI